MNENTYINVATLQPNVSNLGLGNRFAIWVQGCPFNCYKCTSTDWIPFKVANLFSINELKNIILEDENIDGLTISGGEPMMQAGRLALLVELIKKKNENIDVICFTGFDLKNLIWKEAKEFMQYIDVLITGKYIDRLNNNKGLRGSTNQKIHFLTNKLINEKDYFYNSKRDLNFYVTDSEVMMTGIPEKNFKW